MADLPKQNIGVSLEPAPAKTDGFSSGNGEQQKTTPQAQEQPQKNVKTLAKSFCEQTTAHGFSYFVSESLLFIKVCWVLILLAALIGICFHLTGVIEKYFDYPVQEVIRVSHKAVHFPAVTVCNLQPTSRSAVFALWDDPSYVYNREMIKSVEFSSENGSQNLQDIGNRAQSPMFLYENIGKEAASALGHKQADFIPGCTFLGRKCPVESFTKLVDPVYYNCYTFSGKAMDDGGSKAIGSGPLNGLSLILYLEETVNHHKYGDRVAQKNYNNKSQVESSVGARVVVHGPGTRPELFATGLDIMPGHSTNIAISVNKVVKLGHPYGTCYRNTSLPGLPEFAYSTEICFQIRAQEYIHKVCGCLKACLPIPEHLQRDDVQFCGIYKGTDPEEYFKRTICETATLKEFNSRQDLRSDAGCGEPCHRFTYDTALSESKWPGNQYARDFFQRMAKDPYGNDTSLANQNLGQFPEEDRNTKEFADLLRENYARVNVYFKDLDVLVREETPSYELSNLWSDIGGTIGLWAGLSVITVIECITFCGRLVWACSQKNSTNNSVKVQRY